MFEYGLKPITTDNNRYETDKIPITDNRKTILPLWYIVLSVGTDNDMVLPDNVFAMFGVEEFTVILRSHEFRHACVFVTGPQAYGWGNNLSNTLGFRV